MQDGYKQRVSCEELGDKIQSCDKLKSIFGKTLSATFCAWHRKIMPPKRTK